MSRRKDLDPPARLEIHLPETERAWLDMLLWSTVDGRVPLGAHREFFLSRMREFREWKVLDLSPFGFPQGFFVKGPPTVVELLKEKLQNESH